jgi:hypothetical protein
LRTPSGSTDATWQLPLLLLALSALKVAVHPS